MDYVAGFAFTKDADQLVLINKARPAWQRGKLNGVGGKIENIGDPSTYWMSGLELPLSAMIREFEEETGVKTTSEHWRLFGVLESSDCEKVEKIHLFTALSNVFLDVKTTTEEMITLVDPHRLPSNVVPNLRWLVPAALDYHHNPEGFSFLTAEYHR